MRLSYSALVLATIAIGQAVAGPSNHEHLHKRHHAKHMHSKASAVETRQSTSTTTTTSDYLTAADSNTLLTTMGFKAVGINAEADNGNVWIGSDGPYTNEYSNLSGEDLIFVLWGPMGSWVNAVQPLITLSLPPNATTTLSFASGAVGAWSAIYSDTVMSNGQISNTWGEFTMSLYGVVDISREPNMNGHTMSVVGPECTTDMNTCVFVCTVGVVCMVDYDLLNCASGSQPGAQYGTYGGYPSGGCGGLGEAAALYTTFS